MTVLGALRRSMENPSTPLSSLGQGEIWGDIAGYTTSGRGVSEKRAYGLTPYLAAARITSGVLAALPLKVYRNNTRVRVTTKTVIDDPSRRQTPFEWRQTMMLHALSWGNAYARKTRNFADQVVSTQIIHPRFVRVEDVEYTALYPDGKLFLVTDPRTMEVYRLGQWDLMHVPFLSLDTLTGLSILQLCQPALGIAAAAEDTARTLFTKGMRVPGFLKTKNPLKKDQAQRLQEEWASRTAGVDNAGKVPVLDNDAEFQPLTLPPQDAQLLATREFTPSEIARMFGLPPHLVGDVDKSTSWGTGIEQQALGWTKYTLNQWLVATEQRYTRELLPGGWSAGTWYCEHSLEGLLRGDSQGRAEFYNRMVTLGVMTRNEVRVLENLAPGDGGWLSDFLLPSNMTLLKDDGAEIVPLAAAGQPVTGPHT